MKLRKRKLKPNQGILFWVTGLQGSGKTRISKKVKPYIEKIFGKTIFFDGDMIRSIFSFNDYSEKGRLKLDKIYSDFCNIFIKNNINLIFATVSMSHKARKQNKDRFANYVEIYIKRKKSMRQKVRKNIFKEISKQKTELPRYPDLIINNNNHIDLSIIKFKKFLTSL